MAGGGGGGEGRSLATGGAPSCEQDGLCLSQAARGTGVAQAPGGEMGSRMSSGSRQRRRE
jgi:hypothetical protein